MEPGPAYDGAAAIRIVLTTFLRAAGVSLAIALAPAGFMAASAQPLDEVDPAQGVSDSVVDVAGWVVASADNRGLPFAIVDKAAAQILIFSADGKIQGMAPALLGSALGDMSAPGVGDRELKDIPADERTTPAGRYVAGYAPAADGERVLWIDYENAVSIHPLPKGAVSRKEKRKERLASTTPDDNRITHGCVNVSTAFYSKVVAPAFKRGGVFYILPETEPLQSAFPAFGLSDHIASAQDESRALVGFRAGE